jgi:hypothetical protein
MPKVGKISGEISRSRNYQSVRVGVDIEVGDGSIEDAKTMLMTELATLIDEFDENFLPTAEEVVESEPEEDDGKVSKEDLLNQGWTETKNANILMKKERGHNKFMDISSGRTWESQWGKK